MKHIHKKLWLGVSVATALTLTACGGGSSNNDNHHDNTAPSDVAAGVFLDSAVEGLEVWQDGKSIGKTNAQGAFQYHTAGGALTFKLGELVLGSTMPAPVITPANLRTNKNEVVRILQILQSIDNDQNLDNGIQITETVANRFNSNDFTALMQQQNDEQFANDLKLKLDTNQFVQNKEQAEAHFAQTKKAHQAELSALTDRFVGYWQQGCDEGSQEVFQLAKSAHEPNTLVQVGKVLKRQYDNHNCTGPYTPSSYDSSQDAIKVQVLAKNIENGQEVVHVLTSDNNSNDYTVVWFKDNNTFADDGLTFTRVNSLAFNN